MQPLDVYINCACTEQGLVQAPDAHCIPGLPSVPGCWAVQMIVNNLWQLAPPEPPTPQEEAEEARRQQALKVRLPLQAARLTAT